MPIFQIEYEFSAVVQADSLDDAEAMARSVWSQAKYDHDPDYKSIEPVQRLSELDGGWNGKCLPYNGDGIKRLEELLPE
ncbi:hypothetical protein M2318_005111 [Metapseudomonas resinovorans]|uniref:hypothetical protein n=1 Tax=Metapseudomonas resinovorans TaxID=53412 RepID=UPI003D1E342B